MISPPTFPRLLLFAVITLGLAACGFQPRGQLPTLTADLSPLYIEGLDDYSPLHRELSAALQAAGVSLTTSSNSAKALLRIRDRVSGTQILTTNVSNRAVEYELEESLRFSVREVASGQQSETQQVRVERILYNPGTSILAKQHEEDTIRAEMRQDLIRRLINRLASQS